MSADRDTLNTVCLPENWECEFNRDKTHIKETKMARKINKWIVRGFAGFGIASIIFVMVTFLGFNAMVLSVVGVLLFTSLVERYT